MSAQSVAHAPRTVGEIETFITMLASACRDAPINERLRRLLEMPDDKRRNTVHHWVSEMLIAGAPADFIAAIACLSDDGVAEKAYEVIWQCRREQAWTGPVDPFALAEAPARTLGTANRLLLGGAAACVFAALLALAAARLTWFESSVLAAVLVITAVLLVSAADG